MRVKTLCPRENMFDRAKLSSSIQIVTIKCHFSKDKVFTRNSAANHKLLIQLTKILVRYRVTPGGGGGDMPNNPLMSCEEGEEKVKKK